MFAPLRVFLTLSGASSLDCVERLLVNIVYCFYDVKIIVLRRNNMGLFILLSC